MSKLGPHIDIRTHNGQVEQMVAAKPAVIKVVGSRGLLNILHNALPDTILIARNVSTELAGDDFLRFSGGDSPEQTARRWFDVMKPAMQEAPFAYHEGMNEMSNWESMARYGAFDAERQRIMADNGFKAAIGSFATGTPEIVDPNDLWPGYYPALAAAHQYHNLLSLHEYGGLFMDMWYDGAGYNAYPDSYLEGWLFTRYRKVWNKHIKPNGWTDIRIVLTEFGLDNAATSTVVKIAGKAIGPWTQCRSVWANQFGRPDAEQFYTEQLIWADRQMQKDPYVIGATIFTHGTMSPVWGEFDIEGPAADKIYQHIQSSSAEELPPAVTTYVRTTATSGQNIRSTPSLQGSVLTLVTVNDLLLVLEKRAEWTKIQTAKGIVGWALNTYLVEAVPEPPPPPPPPVLSLEDRVALLETRVDVLELR